MRPIAVTFLLAAVGVAAAAGGAETMATATTATPLRLEVGNRISENLPDVPAELLERLNQYQNTRGASFGGWLKDGSMLVTTRFGETVQVHRVAKPLGMREQLTFYPEPVRGVAARPSAAGNGFVFGKDVGGSEFWHLYHYDLDSRQVTRLSQGERSRNDGALFSHDGRQLAYSSTERNGTDSDIWLLDMASGKRRALVTQGGTWSASDFSPDGKRLLVSRYVSANEEYPGEVDLATGELRMFPVDGGKASFGAFVFTPNGKGSYFVSDEESEFKTLRKHDLDKGTFEILSKGIPWEVSSLALARDGKHLAFVTNEDGIGKLHVITVPGHRAVRLPTLPVGVIGAMDFSPDGKQIAVTINSATSPSDIHVIDLGSTTLARWTQSEVGGLDAARFVAPSLVHFQTFDGRNIPAFYYRPAGVTGKVPVVISIHGGPEGQSRPTFNANTQFLVNELKVAVLLPNVRGSTGYGKSFLQLDNGLLRKDSVKDIGALLDWIALQPDLDASRVGVAGGSYGGYMVLASMADYDKRIRAGVDTVGISNFNTFLKNTESYRRDLRRAEYGDERDATIAAFHEKNAPLNNAGSITRPLFVAQGFNDPRVPYTEAEQIVKAVRGNGGDVWFLMYKDEGHGFQKKSNADYFGAATMLFWQKHLLQ